MTRFRIYSTSNSTDSVRHWCVIDRHRASISGPFKTWAEAADYAAYLYYTFPSLSKRRAFSRG